MSHKYNVEPKNQDSGKLWDTEGMLRSPRMRVERQLSLQAKVELYYYLSGDGAVVASSIDLLFRRSRRHGCGPIEVVWRCADSSSCVIRPE